MSTTFGQAGTGTTPVTVNIPSSTVTVPESLTTIDIPESDLTVPSSEVTVTIPSSSATVPASTATVDIPAATVTIPASEVTISVPTSTPFNPGGITITNVNATGSSASDGCQLTMTTHYAIFLVATKAQSGETLYEAVILPNNAVIGDVAEVYCVGELFQQYCNVYPNSGDSFGPINSDGEMTAVAYVGVSYSKGAIFRKLTSTCWGIIGGN